MAGWLAIGIPVFGALLVVGAVFLARREVRLFRERATTSLSILAYTRARLIRRLVGSGLLVVLGLLIGLFPLVMASLAQGNDVPQSFAASLHFGQGYLFSIVGLVAAECVLVFFDLRETHRQLARRMSGDDLREFLKDGDDGGGNV